MSNMEKDYKTILLLCVCILVFVFTLSMIAFLQFAFYQEEKVVRCVNSEECIAYIKNTKKIPTDELLEYFNIEYKGVE